MLLTVTVTASLKIFINPIIQQISLNHIVFCWNSHIGGLEGWILTMARWTCALTDLCLMVPIPSGGPCTSGLPGMFPHCSKAGQGGTPGGCSHTGLTVIKCMFYLWSVNARVGWTLGTLSRDQLLQQLILFISCVKTSSAALSATLAALLKRLFLATASATQRWNPKNHPIFTQYCDEQIWNM